jgi:Sulfotransferase family
LKRRVRNFLKTKDDAWETDAKPERGRLELLVRCEELLSFLNRGNEVKTRAFLVGCPRSGATLLQSMLFAHPEIYTFPESSFFFPLFGVRDLLTMGQSHKD